MDHEILIDKRYLQRIPGLIESAEEIVRVAMFQMMVRGKSARGSSRALAEKLWAKAREGKEVRVLLNVVPGRSRVAQINFGTAEWLKGHGVQVRMLNPMRVCHAKIVIVDDKVSVIGSHNWGPSALMRNFEVSVVVKDVEEVGKLIWHFDGLWSVAHKLGD